MLGPFSSSFELYLFIITFVIWGLSLLLEPFIIKKSGVKNVKTREDRGTYLLIYLSVFISITISFNFGFAQFMLLPNDVYFIGIILVFLGIFLREYAVMTLGRYFSFHISVMKDHKIIESGPYHYIRHPAYTGGISSIIGISIALQSSIAIIIVILLCAFVYARRIKYEEKVLLSEFGEQYAEYSKKTKKLIPFIY